MLETLTIEDDWKATIPDEVRTRYGFEPRTAVRIIETQSGILLVPLTAAPMIDALKAELEDWQALGAESLAYFASWKKYNAVPSTTITKHTNQKAQTNK